MKKKHRLNKLPQRLIALIALFVFFGLTCQAFGQTPGPSFEVGIDTVIDFNYVNSKEIDETFDQVDDGRGFSILMIKNTPLVGVGLSVLIAEANLKKDFQYNNETIRSSLRSSYNILSLVIDLPLSITNFSVFLGGGQYSLSCQSSDNDCSDKTLKDADLPTTGIFATGARLSLNFGQFYRVYVTYMNASIGDVEIKQKESTEVPNPGTYQFDPSASMVSAGIGLSF